MNETQLLCSQRCVTSHGVRRRSLSETLLRCFPSGHADGQTLQALAGNAHRETAYKAPALRP